MEKNRERERERLQEDSENQKDLLPTPSLLKKVELFFQPIKSGEAHTQKQSTRVKQTYKRIMVKIG